MKISRKTAKKAYEYCVSVCDKKVPIPCKGCPIDVEGNIPCRLAGTSVITDEEIFNLIMDRFYDPLLDVIEAVQEAEDDNTTD